MNPKDLEVTISDSTKKLAQSIRTTQVPNPSQNEYAVLENCTNCQARFALNILRGVRVSAVRPLAICPNCGCTHR